MTGIVGNINSVGYGLAAIGGAVGLALVFSAWIQATARQPESAGITRPMMFLGFAMAEALALFGLVLAFVLPDKIS